MYGYHELEYFSLVLGIDPQRLRPGRTMGKGRGGDESGMAADDLDGVSGRAWSPPGRSGRLMLANGK